MIEFYEEANKMPLEHEFRGHVGDLIEISGHHLGESARLGEILEVHGAPAHEGYRVRWDDGRESDSFYPGSDATIRHARPK